MSSIRPCILLLLFHTIIWTVYSSDVIENDQIEKMAKSNCFSLYQYFGDSGSQARNKHNITDAISNLIAILNRSFENLDERIRTLSSNRSFENLDERIRELSSKITAMENMMNMTLERCTSKAKKDNIKCPSGYVYYEQDTFCFKFHDECKSWSEARKVCQQDGGDLISLKAENLDFFLNVTRPMAGKCAIVWVGATNISSVGQWYWLNGERVASDVWHPGEPNNSGGIEYCAEITPYVDHKLNDNDCNRSYHFICRIV